MLLSDAQIICTDSANKLAVTSQRMEVMFPDGTAVVLHTVLENGAPSLTLRALRQGETYLVFDVRRLAPQLARDLPPCPARDVIGLVFFTFRQAFTHAGEFTAKVGANLRALLHTAQAANEAQGIAA